MGCTDVFLLLKKKKKKKKKKKANFHKDEAVSDNVNLKILKQMSCELFVLLK